MFNLQSHRARGGSSQGAEFRFQRRILGLAHWTGPAAVGNTEGQEPLHLPPIATPNLQRVLLGETSTPIFPAKGILLAPQCRREGGHPAPSPAAVRLTQAPRKRSGNSAQEMHTVTTLLPSMSFVSPSHKLDGSFERIIHSGNS